MPSILRINASQPQHVPAGRLLGKMYYSGFLTTALTRDEYSGYPHNGGEHSLSLYLSQADLESFLALVKERYGRHEGVEEFILSVCAKAKVTPPANLLH